jgi:spore coat protein U-like protein
MIRRGQIPVLLLACTLLAASAFGAPATCSVSSTGVAFGTFDTLSGGSQDTLGTVTVTCTGQIGDSANFTIQLTSGAAGSYSPRTMTGSTPQLVYNLYLDSAHTQVWGDGTGGTFTKADSYTLSATSCQTQYTVYGRISGSQSALKAAIYTDSLTIVLNY